MKYKCAIFDLDGTLLDSLQGILDAVNISFKEMGYNVHRTYEEGKYFIGAGAIEFARRAMKGVKISPSKEEELMQSFLVNYSKTQAVSAKPFVGINEMLKTLKKRGYKIAIASNKPQILLEPIVKQVFPDVEFDIAYGQRPNKPEKPDPTILFDIMKELKLNAEDCIYIGDSEYDYGVAHNAGMDSVICLYGYGFYDKEFVDKSTYKVSSVKELTNLLK